MYRIIEHFFLFLTRLGYKCPLGFNAAEYYVSLLGVQLDKEMESRDRIRKICDEYQRSDVAADIENQVGDIKDETEYFNGFVDEKVSGEDFRTNYCKKKCILMTPVPNDLHYGR